MSVLKDCRTQDLKDYDNLKLVKTNFKDECDINVIMRKYQKTGQLPLSSRGEGVFGDFSQLGDYQSCMEVVLNTQQQFETLPASLRRRFGHDIERYLEYVNNPDNVKEMTELGMIDKPVEKVDTPNIEK